MDAIYVLLVLFLCLLISLDNDSRVFVSAQWKAPGRIPTKPQDVTALYGLDAKDLSLAAIGDFNSDRYDDYFVLGKNNTELNVYLWNPEKKTFQACSKTCIDVRKQHPDLGSLVIINVIPSDYDRDGKLDILISCKKERASDSGIWTHLVYFGTHDGWRENGGHDSTTKYLSFTSSSQVTLVDAQGSLHANLFGYIDKSNGYGFYSIRRALKHNSGDYSLNPWIPLPKSPLTNPESYPELEIARESSLELPEFHSSAFVDIDGDGLSDLIVPCIVRNSKDIKAYYVLAFLHRYHMIRGGTDASVFEYKIAWKLDPIPISPVSFADLDGNGSMDMIYTSDKGLHVHFNTQRPYCYSSKDTCDTTKVDCKNRKDGLFIKDTQFGFDISQKLDISNSILFPGFKFKALEGSTLPINEHPPIPLHICDVNFDGYPDLACIVESTSKPIDMIIFLHNIPRTDFKEIQGHRTFELDNTFNITGGSPWAFAFVDILNDGIIDFIVNTKDTNNKILALQNVYSEDAFFMNLVVTNGVCSSNCPVGDRNPRPKPYGVNYPGASFKFTFVDIGGYHRVHASAQYFQTGRMSLMLPSQYLGMGRVNTFVETLAVSVPVHPRVGHSGNSWSNVIPNSNLIVFPPDYLEAYDDPPYSKHMDSTTNRSKPFHDPGNWILELHINPGEYIVWILISLICCLFILLCIVVALKRIELKEDRIERTRTLHSINFDAL
jgi:integrin alpha FG-GAP repeat containing protein 1